MKNTFIKTVKNTVKHWYISLIIGVLFVISALYIFRTPLESYVSLSILFSSLFLVSGILEVIFSLSNRKEIDNWGWTLFAGILNTVIGGILLSNPGFTIVLLPIYVGFGLMFRSIQGMSSSFELKSYKVKGWWQLLVLGIIGLIFSVVMIFNPLLGGITIIYWTAGALLALGIFSIYYAFVLRKLKKYSKRISSDLKDRYEAIQKEMHDQLHDN